MSNSNSNNLNRKTVLITGGAKRVGAVVCQALHAAGMNIVIHYRSSATDATDLCQQLNKVRSNSAQICQADLNNVDSYNALITQALTYWNKLDCLINNASSFYPTPVGNITDEDWDNLINSNMKAPLFLSQAAAPALKQNHGCIINMVDIHAQRPMKNHTVYCAAKAGLSMITQSLAKELGPEIRVNGIAPGAILWPEDHTASNADINTDQTTKQTILERTALKHLGSPDDIAKAILFLIQDAEYITGHIIPVDGGRLLNI